MDVNGACPSTFRYAGVWLLYDFSNASNRMAVQPFDARSLM
jgi:hypothetical protein